nr:DNA/RNA non-specific endonuclease [Arthrobacter sp. ES3-54]
MRPDKRLAAVTALGIDGAQRMDLGRSGIRWRPDPRLGEDQQTGERVYARNDIDRGHLVRGPQPSGARPGTRPPKPTKTPPLHERRTSGGNVQSGTGPLARSGNLPAGQRSRQRPAARRPHGPDLQ